MKTIEVVAAIIQKGDKIFATQRGYGDFKDWWEFPGGNADIQVGKLLYTVEWDYPQFHLTMHCFMCTLVQDALHLNEHEAARWLSMADLHSVNWLPADEMLLPLIGKEMNQSYKSIDNQ